MTERTAKRLSIGDAVLVRLTKRLRQQFPATVTSIVSDRVGMHPQTNTPVIHVVVTVQMDTSRKCYDVRPSQITEGGSWGKQ